MANTRWRHARLKSSNKGLEPASTRACQKNVTATENAPARMIKLTETRQITPYKWVHPSEDR